MNKLACVLLFFASLLTPIGAFAADESAPAAGPDEVEEAAVEPSVLAASPRHLSLATQSDLALYHLSYGDFDSASAELDSLSVNLRGAGFQEASSYSFSLLEYARNYEKRGEDKKAKMLIEHALDISPHNAKVQIAASSFASLLGPAESLRHLSSGVLFLFKHPIACLSLLCNALLVFFAAMAVALALVCVVQIPRHSKFILQNAMNSFAPRYRVVLGPLYLLLICLVPFLGGMFVALAIWSFVLSVYIKENRSLGVLAGLMILVWGLSAPAVNQLRYQLNSDLNLGIENIRNGSFDPQDRALLEARVRNAPSDVAAAFSLAYLDILAGEDVQAEALLSSVPSSADDGNEMLRVGVLNNQAALAYQREDFAAAEEYLSQARSLKPKSFEVLYNLAQVRLAMLDTPGYRELFQAASKINRVRLDNLEALRAKESSGLPRLLLLKAPLLYFYHRLLIKPQISQQQAAVVQQKTAALAASAMIHGSSHSLVYLGIVTLLFGLAMLNKHRAQPWHGYRIINPSCSRIWALLPAGAYLAGDGPLAGLFVLSLFLMLVMLGFGQPNVFLEVIPISFHGQKLFFSAAIALFVVTAAASWGKKSKEA